MVQRWWQRRRVRFLAVLTGTLMVTLGVAGPASASTATGSADPAPDVPFITTSEHPGPPEKVKEAFAEFAECMREQGVDMPEDADRVRIPKELLDEDSEEGEKLRDALEECRPRLDKVITKIRPAIPPERVEEHLDKLVTCLREQGVDAPEFDGGTPDEVREFFEDLSEEAREALEEATRNCRVKVVPALPVRPLG